MKNKQKNYLLGQVENTGLVKYTYKTIGQIIIFVKSFFEYQKNNTPKLNNDDVELLKTLVSKHGGSVSRAWQEFYKIKNIKPIKTIY